MLSSSLDLLLKMPKMTSPKNLFDYDCITLWYTIGEKLADLLSLLCLCPVYGLSMDGIQLGDKTSSFSKKSAKMLQIWTNSVHTKHLGLLLRGA